LCPHCVPEESVCWRENTSVTAGIKSVGEGVVAGAHSCELHMGGGCTDCWYAHCARNGRIWRVICARLWLSTPSRTPHSTDARCDTCVFPPTHTFLWNTMWAQNRPLSTLVPSGWIPRAPIGSGNSHGAHEAESLVRGPHASQEWRSVLTPCQDTRGAPKTLDVPLEININTKIQSPCPEQTRPLLPCTNMPRRWLVKAEPDPHVVRGVDLGSCPYSRLQESGVCLYDGVRNYQARNGVRRCVVWC
jgi:hypothetical protein